MQDAGRVSYDHDAERPADGVTSIPDVDPAPAPAAAGVGADGSLRHPGNPPVNANGHSVPPLLTAKKPPTCLDRSQVLDATARVLREKGYDGTTIRAIAKQLDCAVGSIYRYFPDKRALLDGVCQRRFESVAEHAELRSSVMTSVQMYARVAADQPELYRLMFWLASVGKRQMGEAVPAVVRRVIAGWTEALGDQTRAKGLWAQLHGFIGLGLTPEQAVTMLDLPAISPAERLRHLAPPAAPMPPDNPAHAQATQPGRAMPVGGSPPPPAAASRREDLTLL